MMIKKRSLLNAEEYILYHDEICKENRLALQLMAFIGLPLSIANVFAQLFIAGRNSTDPKNYCLLIYFFFLFLIERYFPSKKNRYATAMIYIAQAPVMILSILLGSIWDPNHQAFTILIFLLALPVFVLDRPIRLILINGIWALLFQIVAVMNKDPDIMTTDTIHIVEVYFASVALIYVVHRIRVDSLRNLERTRYHLEHDELTETRNKRALVSRTDLYTQKPLFVLMAELDQLDLFYDFYGHDTGDEILIFFTQTLKDAFGEEHTYRYGSNEVLCIAALERKEKHLQVLDGIRARLDQNQFEKHRLSLSCAFGFVTGTPQNPKELQEMIQLADIYTHKSRKTGRNHTEGGPFDTEHLHAGIVESSITTHAMDYEINQLTGLPTMSYFLLRCEDLLENIVIQSDHPVVGFLNLVNFKAFNNEFGYLQGDSLLRYTKELLVQNFPGRQLCYISGGQYGVLCYKGETETAMQKICASLSTFRPGYPVSFKAGFADYDGSEKVISLLDRARLAHDSIYHQSGVSFRFYDEKLDEDRRFGQYLIHHLDEAIEKGYLQVYYQPIVRSSTREVCNEEALSRWIDPVYGFLPPIRFIHPLEENHLLYKLNLHVVRQVLKDFSVRKESGIPIVPVSVNLSRFDFEQCDMVQEICDLVDASGFPHCLIKIEITESAFMENQELLKREVNRFRANGFEVWMDDFGSEYSTLNLLQELNFDLIKIDMQFMKNFSPDSRNMIIVESIIEMVKKMGIHTLIEGIETEEHYQLLRELGCEKMQGYLFNKPNPLDYIINRYQTNTGLPFEQPEHFRTVQ